MSTEEKVAALEPVEVLESATQPTAQPRVVFQATVQVGADGALGLRIETDVDQIIQLGFIELLREQILQEARGGFSNRRGATGGNVSPSAGE